MPTIAIPYVPMPAEQNPNTSGRGLDTYLVSSFVTLASLRRWNPNLDLRFVTTEGPEPVWRARLEGIGVEVEHVPFEHRPPEGFAKTFLGSLYLLDVLAKVDADYLIVIDPDVFCVGSLGDIARESGSVRALNIPSPREKKINGLSPMEADDIHLSLGESREVNFHFGGEFYGIPRGLREQIMARVDHAWSITLNRWEQGLTYFTTEEHVLNFALAKTPVDSADDVIQRIWTAHSFRTVSGRERNLLLWHLPAEKERGFRKLYPAALDDASWFWKSGRSDFVRRAGRTFGLHGRGPLRLLLDLGGSAARSVRSRGRSAE